MVKDLNASAASGQSRSQSSTSIEEMQKQLKVKDKVITELAGIIESLEINYGISIDDQTHTFQNFINIARSMEEEAREAGNATAPDRVNQGYYHPHPSSTYIYMTLMTLTGQASSNVPTTPGTSTPQYGRPPANHERIITAMGGFWNLLTMQKMALVKSNARKQVVGRDLESIEALRLLPRRWIER